tara:strand:- start:607 stop:798 length:192 start_codon:yes stop_codon:yes gene_type:complete
VKNSEQRDIERRIKKLEMDTHEFMEIIKHLVKEKKDLQKRLDIMEEILKSYIPELKSNEQKDS